MTGRRNPANPVDHRLAWGATSSARLQHHHQQHPVHDSFVSNTPGFFGGGPSHHNSTAQPHHLAPPPPPSSSCAFGTPESRYKRGFGLMTGVPRAPENLIDDFNKEAYSIMSSDQANEDLRPRSRPRPMVTSPVFTLTTQDVTDQGDLSFYRAFDDAETAVLSSPAIDNGIFSRTDLGIPSSQPLSRNGSQGSSRLQDDTISLAYSNASAGDDFNFPLGPSPFTPGTSFSQDQTSSFGAAAAAAFGTSPVDNCQWEGGFRDGFTPSSPTVDLSTSSTIDLSFSGTSADFSNGIPRSTPRSFPRESELSRSLQSMAAEPNLPEPNLPPDPSWNFELPVPVPVPVPNDELLSASFAYMDSQLNNDGMMPATGFANINITPAHNPMDMMNAQDPFGTSPLDLSSLDFINYTQPASRSFPAPQRLPSEDLLAVPFAARRRDPRRPRANSASGGGRPPSAASTSRLSTSTNPIPIPRRPQQTRMSQPRSLPSPITHSNSTRGRRKGPMQEYARQSAKKTRNERTICIRCKGSKQGCHRPEDHPEGTCINCEKIANSPKWPGPCTKAYFEDLVLAGTLNTRLPREMTHLTTDHSQRIHKSLALDFCLDDFVRLLDQARGRCNLRVYHGPGEGAKCVYGLNLDNCYKYLKKVNEQLLSREEPGGREFAGFLDKDLVHVESKTDDWPSVITEASPSPQEDIVQLYLAMSSMPEHATFYYTSTPAHGHTTKQRPIDPLNPAEDDFLQLAACLSRIVYRKVEIAAVVQLQKDLHDILLNPGSQNDLVTALRRLGRVLVSLRAQAAPNRSRSTAYMAPPSPQTECRVTELCRVLYFYYHAFRRRLPPPQKLNDAWERSLEGTWTRAAPSEPIVHSDPSFSSSSSSSSFAFPYASPSSSASLLSMGLTGAGDAVPKVFNIFPTWGTESTKGFEAWMDLAPAGSGGGAVYL